MIKRNLKQNFMRPVKIGRDLRSIVGSEPIPRTEVTRRLLDYIKENGLQDKTNKKIITDKKLRKVCEGKDSVDMVEMIKFVNKNLIELKKEESSEDKANGSKLMQKLFKKKEVIDEELLKESLNELNQLIGIDNVKKSIVDLIKRVRYHIEEGNDVKEKFSFHSIFTGNPGTGKTTVARIMARSFQALGILDEGHLKEVDRYDLVAEYVGQTALKTKKAISEAMGGILFIDEAYSLVSYTPEDFGIEAIDTLVKQMEDNRGKLIVICAGYPKLMEVFLKSNPGLKSRIDKNYHFNDYTQSELLRIGIIMLKLRGLEIDKVAMLHFKKIIKSLSNLKEEDFGNAREIRKLIESIVEMQELRLANIPRNKRTKKSKNIIKFDDVKHLKPHVKKKSKIKGNKIKKISLGFEIPQLSD